MLVVKRKTGQRIVIKVPPSDQEQLIEVAQAGTRRQPFKIGVEAPEQIKIVRKELEEKE